MGTPSTKYPSLSSSRYRSWLSEVVLDFGSCTFTRRELNDLGVGMHFRAAAHIQRVCRDHRWTLGAVYAMGATSCYNTKGIGETSLIVLAYCIAAANPRWDVMRWIGHYGRTVSGAVRTSKKRKKS